MSNPATLAGPKFEQSDYEPSNTFDGLKLTRLSKALGTGAGTGSNLNLDIKSAMNLHRTVDSSA